MAPAAALLLASSAAMAQPAGQAPPAQPATMMGSGVAQFTLPPQQPQLSKGSSEASTAARVEPAGSGGFLFRANLGVSALRLSREYESQDAIEKTVPEISIDLGARLHEFFGVGAHAGIHAGVSWKESYWHDIDNDVAYYGVGVTPMELGASLHFFPTDRLWISPWAGFAALGRAGGTQGIVGVSAGVDLVTSERAHRLGLYAQGLRTSGYSEDTEGLRSFSLGATYSFR